jgi:hypothetical protein
MSHTMTVQGWKLHFNSDFSGPVGIVSPEGKDSIIVPFEVLAEFVGSALRDRDMSALGDLTGHEYLNQRMRR